MISRERTTTIRVLGSFCIVAGVILAAVIA
jgi:hypothetical protein